MNIYDYYALLINWPFYCYKKNLSIHDSIFALKFTLLDIYINNPGFFLLILAWYTTFIPLLLTFFPLYIKVSFLCI